MYIVCATSILSALWHKQEKHEHWSAIIEKWDPSDSARKIPWLVLLLYYHIYLQRAKSQWKEMWQTKSDESLLVLSFPASSFFCQTIFRFYSATAKCCDSKEQCTCLFLCDKYSNCLNWVIKVRLTASSNHTIKPTGKDGNTDLHCSQKVKDIWLCCQISWIKIKIPRNCWIMSLK